MIENIAWALPENTVVEIKKIMRENDYSQLPVKEKWRTYRKNRQQTAHRR